MIDLTKGSRFTVGMLVADLFEDLEFWSVAMRGREAGYRVLVIGSKSGKTYASKSGGLEATSEAASPEMKAEDTRAPLLIPGGFAPETMRRDTEMLRLIRELDEAGKTPGFHLSCRAAGRELQDHRRAICNRKSGHQG